MKIPRLLPPALALAALAWAGWYFSAQPGQPTPPPAQYRRLSPEQLDSLWRETVRQGREPRLSYVTKSPHICTQTNLSTNQRHSQTKLRYTRKGFDDGTGNETRRTEGAGGTS